ncbi:MAG: TIGR02444 family protein [Alphaproteobacteria bacterium]|nr:TIGR02444 family protein [Alphaproteobacteria bacterium]
MEFPEHPFWDFALDVYRREGVGAACLHLQDRHGVDVNVMLFCLWLGASGRGVMTGDELQALNAATANWHRNVVRRLRAVRQVLKDGFADAPEDLCERLRGQVQAVEIDSEHLEQLMMAAAVDRPPTADDQADDAGARAASLNFDLYLDDLGIAFEPADAVQFAHILGQTFPGLSPGRALDLAEVLM